MGNKRFPSFQSLFITIRVNFDFHSQCFRKERRKKKIVISLEILDPNTLVIQPLQSFKNREVFRKDKGLCCPEKTLKPKKEFEKVAQHHQTAYPVLLPV